MAVKYIICLFIVCALVDVVQLQPPAAVRLRSLCRIKAASFQIKDEDTTQPSVNDTEPAEKPKESLLRHVLPTDFKDVLHSYRCNCHKIGSSNPLVYRRSENTCSSVERAVTIKEAAWGCWVHRQFANHICPYTTCDQFGNCNGVKPWYGVTRCVQDHYKDVVFYAWCLRPNGWNLEKKRLGLPTCCSCRWFCG